eukprot:10560569-Karenia_brevis.AAC.1
MANGDCDGFKLTNGAALLVIIGTNVNGDGTGANLSAAANGIGGTVATAANAESNFACSLELDE